MTVPIIDTQERIVDAPWTFLRLPKTFIDKFQTGDTTPSVSNRLSFESPGAATTITNFDDGVDGQSIMILGNGNLTITHGTNIFTNTGANKVLAANMIYHFSRFNNKWYEDA